MSIESNRVNTSLSDENKMSAAIDRIEKWFSDKVEVTYMATYRQIQDYVRKNYQCSVKTCWIAHVKELNKITLRTSPNRISKSKRKYPCPEDKRAMIEEAMRHFGMI